MRLTFALFAFAFLLNALPANALTNQDPDVPAQVQTILKMADDLLSPVMQKPIIQLILDSQENNYRSGVGVLRVQSGMIAGLLHEYGHAYFDLNIKGLDGRSFRAGLAPSQEQLLRLTARQETTNPFSSEGQEIAKQKSKTLDLILEYSLRSNAEDELFADLVAVLGLNDMKAIAEEVLRTADGDLVGVSAEYANGAKKSVLQRSFDGDSRYVLLHPEPISGTDYYGVLNETRYFLGSLIKPNMSHVAKVKLLKATLASMQAMITARMTNESSFAYSDYVKTNQRLIDLIAQQMGVKSRTVEAPLYIGPWDKAPREVLEEIERHNQAPKSCAMWPIR